MDLLVKKCLDKAVFRVLTNRTCKQRCRCRFNLILFLFLSQSIKRWGHHWSCLKYVNILWIRFWSQWILLKKDVFTLLGITLSILVHRYEQVFLLNNKCDTFLKKSSYATLGNEKYIWKLKTCSFYSHTENRLQASLMDTFH